MRNDFKVGEIWKYNFSDYGKDILRFKVLSVGNQVEVQWIDGNRYFYAGQIARYGIKNDDSCEIDETSMAKRILETYESKPGGQI
jgi:hypothetical protein